MNTKETDYVKQNFLGLGRKDKIAILSSSTLNDREIDLLTKRFINGLSLKECSEDLGLEINTISKKQNRAFIKLYQYLVNN